jgi:hypothetical protein
MFLEAGGDGSEMLEFVEQTFDQVMEAIEVRAGGRDINSSWHGFGLGPAWALLFAQAPRPAEVLRKASLSTLWMEAVSKQLRQPPQPETALEHNLKKLLDFFD